MNPLEEKVKEILNRALDKSVKDGVITVEDRDRVVEKFATRIKTELDNVKFTKENLQVSTGRTN